MMNDLINIGFGETVNEVKKLSAHIGMGDFDWVALILTSEKGAPRRSRSRRPHRPVRALARGAAVSMLMTRRRRPLDLDVSLRCF